MSIDQLPATPTPSPTPQGQQPGQPALGRELGGDLPCVVCGYNLRGLSIRSMCPECGTGVRATILALVDPQASELQPIRFPRLVASAVVLWAAGAVAVAMMCWLPHAADALRTLGVNVERPSAKLGVMLGLITSLLGAFVLVRPHAKLGFAVPMMTLLGALLYLPLGYVMWKHQALMDAIGGPRYLTGWAPMVEATTLNVTAFVLIAAIIMLQRPIARTLVARSLVMRTGRVDRQTMYAMAIACGLAIAGVLLGRAVPSSVPMWADLARVSGIVLIGFGSAMLSIGLLGSLLDCARIASAIVAPKPTLRKVIREGHAQPKTAIGKLIDPTPTPIPTSPSMLTPINPSTPPPPSAGPYTEPKR
ncbi:MAG: hypothetical protein K2W85_09515 [Phycisphaerales bacterium]|nr:hypothetical protein [Phycisphaerales bacterium]